MAKLSALNRKMASLEIELKLSLCLFNGLVTFSHTVEIPCRSSTLKVYFHRY